MKIRSTLLLFSFGLAISSCTNDNVTDNFTESAPLAVNPPSISPVILQTCPYISSIASHKTLPSVNHITADDGRQLVSSLSSLSYECDTRGWLSEVVREVTLGATSDLESGMRWTTFIQNTIAHSCMPPIDEQAQAVYHPIALLEDRRMHCGQTARLVVDGLTTLGIPARVLQMKGHVSAEFFANGRWIFAESDILSGGEFLLSGEGEAVGIDEALINDAVLDSVNPYKEVGCQTLLSPEQVLSLYETYGLKVGIGVGEGNADVWKSIFDIAEYGDSVRGSLTTPFVIKKTPSLEQERTSHYFGWNYYEFCERSDPNCTN